MKLTAFGASDVGLKRTNNEDRFLVDESLGLFVVCDGMGGHSAGEVAAETAVNAVADFIRQHKDELAQGDIADVQELAEDAVRHAAAELQKKSASDLKYAAMGTTLSMLLLRGDRAWVTHVGDSRIYLNRGDRIALLTTDHTMANEMVRKGAWTEEEAAESHWKNVLTRHLGPSADDSPDSITFRVEPGDRFLLCSDGLSNYFQKPSQIRRLLSHDHPETTVRSLIAFAKQAGGTDNITAVVVQCD